MVAVTVNQGLDKLLSKYNSQELNSNQTLNTLRMFLCKLKMSCGGNSKLPDPDKVNKVIDTGKEAE